MNTIIIVELFIWVLKCFKKLRHVVNMVNVSIAINKETRLQTETVRVVCMLNVSSFWYMLFISLFFLRNCKINNLKKSH